MHVCDRARSRLGARRAHRAARSGTMPGNRRAASTSATAASAFSATALYFQTPDCHLVSLEHQGRQRALAQADLRSRSVLLRLGRADHRQESRHRRRRAATISTCPATSRRTIPETGDMQWRWYGRAAEEGRSRVGHLAERRGDAARRRHDVAAADLRSRAEPDLRHHRQSAAGHRARQPRRATISSPARSSR